MSTSKEIRYVVAPERMPMLSPEQMTDAQKEVAAEISAGPRGKVIGPFISILRSPGFARHTAKLGAYVRFESPLAMRIREMAALMGARMWTQQFEWTVHIPHALESGLDASIIDAIRDGRRPARMARDEEIVYDFMMELLVNKGVCDTTYKRALDEFGEAGIVDLVGTSGYYIMIGMIMNVARTAHPEQPLPLAPLPDQVIQEPISGSA